MKPIRIEIECQRCGWLTIQQFDTWSEACEAIPSLGLDLWGPHVQCGPCYRHERAVAVADAAVSR